MIIIFESSSNFEKKLNNTLLKMQFKHDRAFKNAK